MAEQTNGTVNGNGKPSISEQIGGRKFIIVAASILFLVGMFYVCWKMNILDKGLVMGFLWALSYIITVGVAVNLLEKLLPYIPDVVEKFTGTIGKFAKKSESEIKQGG